MMMKKKKTRRDGKSKASSSYSRCQDVEQESNQENERVKKRKRNLLTSSASNVKTWDTLPRSVLSSLRRRLKQLMRGKAMRSNT
jgi:hypothetical protein